jgi:pyruvate dehydrogenase E2 component (dihydrolipoamide acetyltransferase)
MPTDVVMPQMGESVAEGTIVRWLKKIGDAVERDEPLFEISTDKVDAEIPSPAAGVLAEIRHKEGETVDIDTVVAVIDQAGAPARPPAAKAPAGEAAAPASPTSAAAIQSPHAAPAAITATPAAATRQPAPAAPRMMPTVINAATAAPARANRNVPAHLQRSSPLVRKIAKEHNVDISLIDGTGAAGRVTRNDILAFLSGPTPRPSRPAPAPPTGRPAAKALKGAGVAAGAGLAGQTVPMSVMRKKIAEHMTHSRDTAAHVHSVFEINYHTVDQIRKSNKAAYEAQGARLTYLSFIIKAAADALKAVPVINASVVGESIAYHKDIHIGIAVALDWGLIVPVVKHADQKSLLAISQEVADLANRARAKQLKPEDVSGGTFTITNPGTFGAVVGMPIINQPQLAIVAVGAIEKRVVVIDDAIAIRPMGFLSIGFDHRVIDGAVADEWLGHVKHALEHWDPSAV